MKKRSGRFDSSGSEPSRKEQRLREFASKLVQLGWQKADSPELEAQIDGLRQHASEELIESLINAFQRRIEGDASCGRSPHSSGQPLEGAMSGQTFSTEELLAEGYATPVATLKTAVWTGLRGDANAYFECFTPELREEFRRASANNLSQQSCAIEQGYCSPSSDTISGLRIYAEHAISATESRLDYEIMFSGSKGHRSMQPFTKIGDDWKISGPPEQIH